MSKLRQDEAKILETKVVILGHTGVGKTSMVYRYIRGQFVGNTTATIGAAFMKKDVQINGWNVVLQIWDTAGQERFRSMAPMYYRNAHAAILVYDATSPESFEKVAGWVSELQLHANNDILMILCANKSDLRDSAPENCVNAQEASNYAKEIGAVHFHTSAKTGKGIDEVFSHVAKRLLDNELAKQRSDKSGRREDGARASVALGDGFYHYQEAVPPPKKGCCG